jgi:ComF family protein
MPAAERYFRPFLDILFPPVCLLCGGLSAGPHPHCCPACRSAFRPLPDGGCPRCGEPLPTAAFDGEDPPHPCLRCLTAPPSFAWCRGLFAYEGEMKEALSLLKYGRRLSLLPPLREALLEGAARLSLPPFDAVAPVPLSPWGTLKRTFNQAVVLAGPLARRHGVPLVPDALARRGARANMGLARGQRDSNARKSFLAGRGAGRLEGKRVLLFDDVYTTGATVAACARLLAGAGAAEVGVLTLARTPGWGAQGRGRSGLGGKEDLRHGGVEQAVGSQRP